MSRGLYSLPERINSVNINVSILIGLMLLIMQSANNVTTFSVRDYTEALRVVLKEKVFKY